MTAKNRKLAIVLVLVVGAVLFFHFQGLDIRVGKSFEFGMGKYYGSETGE